MKLTQLLLKKLNKTISEKENKSFNEWYDKSENNRELFSRLVELHNKGLDIAELESLDPQTAWNAVLQQFESKKIDKNGHFNFRPVLSYATVFIVLIALGYGYYKYSNPKNGATQLGQDVITLQLDNGEIQVLSTDDAHAITDAKGNVLGKKEGSKLEYDNAKTTGKLIYNTLAIPYGKRFEIALSDGTTVYLNAGSSLRYPVSFTKDHERRVFLKGEAFFVVSEDKENPFIVSASGMDVTVFGTEFNVTAYPDEVYTNTVLVEGSVGLSNSNNQQRNNVVRLEPGDKAEWDNHSGKATVEQVDTDIYTGWISGKLIIRNLPFKNIIAQLERYYNVEIENNYRELDTQVYTATFDNETIEDVLGSFAENKKFDFEITNNTIFINQP